MVANKGRGIAGGVDKHAKRVSVTTISWQQIQISLSIRIFLARDSSPIVFSTIQPSNHPIITMPNENKRRGRRLEKTGKRHQYEKAKTSVREDYSAEEPPQLTDNQYVEIEGGAGDDYISLDPRGKPDDTPFYGLLDQQEQEYYANVNVKLEANDFESAEDKHLFLDAVYRESHGKELKIASSQSCSRYLERVIRVSTVEQVKALFGKFVGHFLQLVQHRFASHCCEALFMKSAPAVGRDADEGDPELEGGTLSLERLFITVVDELEPNLGYLLTERFASHVIRVLLLVLSGEPLKDRSTSNVLASRRKESIEMPAGEGEVAQLEARKVPQSFNDALKRLITSSVAGLDTTYIRALATHPTGNPILQLLLRLELVQGGKSKSKDANSVMHRLLPEESLEEDTESAKFILGLLYDPTGSRLLETIIQHAPGKMFKKLYSNLLKQKLGAMAKNEIASYVAIRILERLSGEDLKAARDEILPEIPTLVARNRVGVVRVLVERCEIRQVNALPVVSALKIAYGEESSAFLLKMLKMEPRANATEQSPGNQNGQNVKPGADVHGSLLAQSLLQSSATFDTVHQCLQTLSSDTLLVLAKDPAASRVIQVALSASTSSPQSNRKLVPKFYGRMAQLAIDVSGSHVADVLWYATNGSHFMKERLAQEMQAGESQLRESRYGRTVWKNWSMDIFQRRPLEWQALAKGMADQASEEASKKSALELARERYVSRKVKGQRPAGRSNAVLANA
jgi:nucleolar protein 9